LRAKNSWDETKALAAPWLEIEAHMVIFTVPTCTISDGIAGAKVIDRLDHLVVSLLTFFSDSESALDRVGESTASDPTIDLCTSSSSSRSTQS
jgi:hypothetical protein